MARGRAITHYNHRTRQPAGPVSVLRDVYWAREYRGTTTGNRRAADNVHDTILIAEPRLRRGFRMSIWGRRSKINSDYVKFLIMSKVFLKMYKVYFQLKNSGNFKAYL